MGFPQTQEAVAGAAIGPQEKSETNLSDYEVFKISRQSVALGIESGEIPNEFITASSQHDDNHQTKNSRLNYAGPGSHAWCAKNEKGANHWIQIQFPSTFFVTGFAIQPRGDHDQRVTKLSVSYSLTGINWVDTEAYLGNTTPLKTPVKRDFKQPFRASFVRINILEYHGHPSLRCEFYGLKC
eukprot:TRINITY_DN4605_c0_g1_i1.p1 TRINITY_DN4605_c0_g1~~TRINITY_DN4605_c0_g1_i1.p1  ORF type:complete len:183 (+),score=15.01 TRINITY_DN4605_c0_g1_i1:65-613(+)